MRMCDWSSDLCASDLAGLRYRIWHAVRDAVQTTDRRRQHDAAVTGLAHPWKRGTDDMERAHQMHVDDRLEVFMADVFERAIAHVAGVVDQHVDKTEIGRAHV